MLSDPRNAADDLTPSPEPIEINYYNSRMLLYLKDLSWNDARDYCDKHKGYLTETYNIEVMKAIAETMAVQISGTQKLQHISGDPKQKCAINCLIKKFILSYP